MDKHVENILLTIKPLIVDCVDYMDAAFDNFPDANLVRRYASFLGSPKATVEDTIALLRVRSEFNMLSFNETYEIESNEPDEAEDDDEDLIEFELESGYRALNEAFQSLSEVLLYLNPIREELPIDLRQTVDTIWPIYETFGSSYFNGHWWKSGKYVDNDQQFMMFLLLLYRMKTLVETSSV